MVSPLIYGNQPTGPRLHRSRHVPLLITLSWRSTDVSHHLRCYTANVAITMVYRFRYNFQIMLPKMFFSIYSDPYSLSKWRHRDRSESPELYQLSKSDKYKVSKDIIDFFSPEPRNCEIKIHVLLYISVYPFAIWDKTSPIVNRVNRYFYSPRSCTST